MAARHPLSFDPIEEARRQWIAHGWEKSARGMAAVTSVMRAQQIFLARADSVLKGRGLTFPRYEVLMLLSFARRGSLPLGKVGERLQVNAASVTNAIDRLEKAGLVKRVPNPRDGRGILAAITGRGRRLAEEATAAMNRDLFDHLGPSEETLDKLFVVLKDLRSAAGDF